MKKSHLFLKINHRRMRFFKGIPWVVLFGIAACSLDTADPPDCGNGSLDDAEICDGDKLSYEASCPDGTELPENASLSCNADCSLNTDACLPVKPEVLCGNGALDDGEICDGDKLSDNASCPVGTELPENASLSCNADCSLNTDACLPVEIGASCGNGFLDDDEICDGSLISATATCPAGMHLAEGMSFTCDENCTLDTSACEQDASDTIPQGRIIADLDHPELDKILLHRTPQDQFPNDDLYSDRKNEPSQIVMEIPIGDVVDLVGSVGNRWLARYHDEEGYIHSKYVERINSLDVPALDYTSEPSNNYYQFDPKWKDTKFSEANYTIETNGGSPVCVTDAVSAVLKRDELTPDVIAQKMGPTFGKSKDHVCKFVEKEYRVECHHYDNTAGMNCVTMKNNDATVRTEAKNLLKEAFKNGWYIVAEVGEANSEYWEADRNVMVYGYDSQQNRVFFDDPRNKHYMSDLESFLDCNHSFSIVTNTCIPKTCKDVTPECGAVSDGCGQTMDCPCTPMGTATKDTNLRRSPQNNYPQSTYTNGLLHNNHTSDLKAGENEEPQIAGTLSNGTEVEILGRVKKNAISPAWYHIQYNNKKYYVLASDLKTNGAAIKDYSYFPGATSNYAQGDSRWGSQQYSCSGCTIATDGCGPSSMANALSTLLGQEITPSRVANEFRQTGTENTQYQGTWSDNRMCQISTIKSNQLKCNFILVNNNDERNSVKQKIQETLNAGGYVLVYHEGQCYWTNAGHYITVYGYDGEYFYADDPMERRYHQKVDDFMKSVRGVALITK